MKKIILSLILLLLTNNVYSVTLVKGVIQKNTGFYAHYPPATYKKIPFEFPRKDYTVDALDLINLEYDRSVSLKEKESLHIKKIIT